MEGVKYKTGMKTDWVTHDKYMEYYICFYYDRSLFLTHREVL